MAGGTVSPHFASQGASPEGRGSGREMKPPGDDGRAPRGKLLRVLRPTALRARPRGLARKPGRLGEIRGYIGAMTVLALCTGVSFAGLHTAAFVTVLPVGVLAITARFGIAPAIFTAVAGVLVFDFVFV